MMSLRSTNVVANGRGMGEMEEILVKGYKLPVKR